ncbi:MAG: hypothetical protein R3F09_01415 [Burkholderiaceae bacterium]
MTQEQSHDPAHPRIPVFYRPEMNSVVSEPSISKSSEKPGRFVEFVKGLSPTHIDIKDFDPVQPGDIGIAHDQDYVQGILACELPNGFMTFDKSVADSLPYTLGSMVAATMHCLNKGGIACSPSSGFHHAGWDFGGGFCTFNGLMVAAYLATAEGAKVGILDCDAHYGNGTQDILDRLGDDGIVHRTMGKHFPCGQHAGGFIQWLLDAVDDMKDCDVVIYQAGADPFIHDPMGGQLTLQQLALRDEYVFEHLRNVAWNLAGGYCAMTHDIHNTTFLAAYRKTNREAGHNLS